MNSHFMHSIGCLRCRYLQCEYGCGDSVFDLRFVSFTVNDLLVRFGGEMILLYFINANLMLNKKFYDKRRSTHKQRQIPASRLRQLIKSFEWLLKKTSVKNVVSHNCVDRSTLTSLCVVCTTRVKQKTIAAAWVVCAVCWFRLTAEIVNDRLNQFDVRIATVQTQKLFYRM